MPHRVVDQLYEVFVTGCGALVRSLEDGDAVGHGEGFEDAALGEGTAFVESKQCVAAAGEAELAGGRFGLDHDGEILHAAAKAERDLRAGAGDEAVEVSRGHRRPK